MTMINLLPPQEKERILWEKRLKMFVIIEILVLSCLLVLYLSFLALKINIGIQKNTIEAKVEIERPNILQVQKVKKEIRSINKTLNSINQIYKEQIFVSDLLFRFIELLPKDAYLTYFYFDKEERNLQIVGKIATLSSLNQFKDTLKKETEFKKVEFSIGTYMPTREIEFQVKISL
ncbi:MAG: hypothetical protein LR000_01640 [Candidatus Pacebacteria bacterium]|nr:hypothetical protein [Candidatus Paceibacterota bacterium]